MPKKQKQFIHSTKGEKQRSDITLNKEVAGALTQIILSGGNLFERGSKSIDLPIGGELKKISKNTVKSWISRGNVVPETKEVLRDLLKQSKRDYRIHKAEEKRIEMIEDAIKTYKRILSLKTNVVLRDMNGETLKNPDTGEILRRENPSLLKIKVDASKFILERLCPETYGKIK